MQSPIKQFVDTFISSISLPHRSFSEARPPTNLSARPSFSRHASAISSTSCFSAVAASNLSCKAWSSSSHLLTVACAAASDSSAAALDAFASSRASMSGVTLT